MFNLYATSLLLIIFAGKCQSSSYHAKFHVQDSTLRSAPFSKVKEWTIHEIQLFFQWQRSKKICTLDFKILSSDMPVAQICYHRFHYQATSFFFCINPGELKANMTLVTVLANGFDMLKINSSFHIRRIILEWVDTIGLRIWLEIYFINSRWTNGKESSSRRNSKLQRKGREINVVPYSYDCAISSALLLQTIFTFL